MATYTAEVSWQRNGEDFLGNRYSRRHAIRFDGGALVVGSSSPHVVPLPMSDASAVDPEEAFVASLSSCHMLWFLSIAAKHKILRRPLHRRGQRCDGQERRRKDGDDRCHPAARCDVLGGNSPDPRRGRRAAPRSA